MTTSKISMRIAAIAGGLTLLAGSSAFAQQQIEKPRDQGSYNENVGGRTIEGTVESVAPDRDGQRVRLTNGTNVLVPNSVTGTNQGHRWGASNLQRGDTVRMNVYDNGDGRDALVRSMEMMASNSNYNYNNSYNNDQRFDGTVVSFNRRRDTLVMRSDEGRNVNVSMRAMDGRNNTSGTNFRRGQRISVTGRLDRGVLIADDVQRIRDNRSAR